MKTKRFMGQTGRGAGALPSGLVCILVSVGAHAADLSVDCDAGDSLQAAIDSLDPVGPHTITVTGTCAESVNIEGRERLTLQGGTIQSFGPLALRIFKSRDINLSGLSTRGPGRGLDISGASSVFMDGCTVENHAGNGIFVSENSHLNVLNSALRNNGGYAINVFDSSSIHVQGGVTIENNNAGLRLAVGSRGRLDGFDPNNGNAIQNNNNAGFVVNYASSINVIGKNDILNNGSVGLQLAAGSGAWFSSFEDGLRITISGHTFAGLRMTTSSGAFVTGPTLITANGSGGPEDAGIHVEDGSSALLQTGPIEVTGNFGFGLLAQHSGNIHLVGASITGNSAGGIRVARMSTVKFGGDEGDEENVNTLSGNGGADLSCDTTSLVTDVSGDLSDLSHRRIDCKRIERDQGPPRPGRIK